MKRSFPKKLVAAAMTAVLLAGSLQHQPLDAAAVQASRSSDFIDSIGFKTHFNIDTGNGIYGSNPSAVLQKMKNLGIRNYVGYYKNSFRDYGLKGAGYANTTDSNGILDNSQIDAALNRYNGYEGELIGIEGPNEYDLFSTDPNWAANLKNYMGSLYNKVKNRPSMAGLPVIGPSLSDSSKYAQLGNITDRSNIGNGHPYSGELEPESFWFENSADGYFIDHWKSDVGNSNPGQPFWATETGYYEINDNVRAKYVPRTYAWFFKHGVKKTFLYQFADFDGPWGIIREDLTEKPAYTSLKNLISIVKDNNSTFTPSSLNYTLSGDTSNVHDLLLQRGDGTYFLLLWQGARSWNRDADVQNSVGNKAVTVFIDTSMKAGKLYRPLNSAAAVETYVNPTTLTIQVPDDIMVLELTPGPKTIPGKLSAEGYSAMNGIGLESTTDTGGGLNIGYIDAGDWTEYPVNVSTSGTYQVNYRVASPNASGQVQFRKSDGTILSTTNIPNTGGWQTWQTVSANVNLNAGNQTIRLYFSGGGFNMNYFELVKL